MIGSYFAHYLSVGLCLVAMWCSVANIRKTRILPKQFRPVVICYIGFSIFTLLIFVSLKLSSIISGELFHKDGSIWVVGFEYFNAMAYIFGMVSLTLGLNIYKGLKERVERGDNCSSSDGCLICGTEGI